MSFSIIPIRLYCIGLRNWNDFLTLQHYYASLAQPVEQLIRNEQVVGSSPIGGSVSENRRGRKGEEERVKLERLYL